MNDKKNIEKVNPDPVAILIKDELAAQINTFLALDPEERNAGSRDLFDIQPYPAHLKGCEGAEKYEVYLLERSTRMSRDDRNKHGRLSCSIVCLDKETKMPRFFAQGVIMPSDIAMVTVYEQDEKGTDYRKTAKWNNKDTQK